jgi:hypothetical protein
MHIRMVLLEPLFAFLDRSAELAILIQTFVSLQVGQQHSS